MYETADKSLECETLRILYYLNQLFIDETLNFTQLSISRNSIQRKKDNQMQLCIRYVASVKYDCPGRVAIEYSRIETQIKIPLTLQCSIEYANRTHFLQKIQIKLFFVVKIKL